MRRRSSCSRSDFALEQVRPQGPAHEVVEREPAAERLGEAARLEPAHGLRGVGLGQHVTQQLERRHARDAGHAEHVAVAALDLGLREPAHERPHHLAGLARPRAPAAVLSRRRGERQRERRAARPVRQLVAAGPAEPVDAEQLLGLGERQRAELDLARDPLPTTLEPAALRRLAARDDDDRVLGERRQDRPPQVAAERGHALVGVDEDQWALVLMRSRERLLDRVRDGRQLAALDEHRRPAGLPAAVCDLAQQSALADAAGAMDEHYARRGIVHEQLGNRLELAVPPDEGRPVAPGHPCTQIHVCWPSIGERSALMASAA